MEEEWRHRGLLFPSCLAVDAAHCRVVAGTERRPQLQQEAKRLVWQRAKPNLPALFSFLFFKCDRRFIQSPLFCCRGLVDVFTAFESFIQRFPIGWGCSPTRPFKRNHHHHHPRHPTDSGLGEETSIWCCQLTSFCLCAPVRARALRRGGRLFLPKESDLAADR